MGCRAMVKEPLPDAPSIERKELCHRAGKPCNWCEPATYLLTPAGDGLDQVGGIVEA